MQRYCDKRFPPQTITETETIIEYRDSIVTVTVPADTVSMVETEIITVEKETGLVNMPMRRLDSQFAYATAEIIDSRLQFYLYQKEQKIEQTIKNAIKEATTTVIKEIPYQVHYITWWDGFWIRLGKVFVAALGLVILIGVVRGSLKI